MPKRYTAWPRRLQPFAKRLASEHSIAACGQFIEIAIICFERGELTPVALATMVKFANNQMKDLVQW